MTPTKPGNNDDGDSYMFRVEILVNAQNRGNALEHLLSVLKDGGFTDYRIGSGIGRGRTIEEAVEREKKKRAGAAGSSVVDASSTKSADAKKSAPNADAPDLEQRIRAYIQSNKLVRLNANKGRGVKVSMPCRILNFDADKELITVYHVDEKQVHSFKLAELEDIIE